MTVILNDRKYESKDNDEVGAKEVSEYFYKTIAEMNSLQIELVTGSYLVLGETALKQCAIIFSDTPLDSIAEGG